MAKKRKETKRTVWVADDSEPICQITEAALSRYYEIRSFTTLKDLSEALEDNCPDALVLDIIFGRNKTAGLDFLRAFRKVHPGLPVIIISATEDTEVAALTGGLSIWCYVRKDPKEGELTERLRKELHDLFEYHVLNSNLTDILDREDLLFMVSGKALNECDSVVQRSFKVFLEELPSMGPSITLLSRRCKVSSSTLNKHYHSEFKQSVGDFLTYFCVQLAARLIQSGCSVDGTAHLIGMNPERLRQRFQSEFGLPPSRAHELKLQ